MGVSHALSRHFFWSENILWKEDIANHRVTVVLGGQDLIVNAVAVKAYLLGENSRQSEKIAKVDKWVNGDREGLPWKGDGLDVLWFPSLDHAQTFDRRRTRKRLTDAVRRYCELK
jgi:hypothetical protein